MRILYISQGNIPSKYAHTFQAMKMAEAFARCGTSVEMVTGRGLIKGRGNELDPYQWYGVEPVFPITSLPVRRRLPVPIVFGDTRKFARFASFYARYKRPDLVYTRSLRSARICVKLGMKTVLETHEEPERLAILRGAFAKRKFLGLVTVTNYLKKEYIEAGFPEDKIFVWPDAVDMKRFSNPPHHQSLRQQLGLPTHRRLVVYCGHFYEKKGVPCLIEGAKRLAEAEFCLVGGWPEDIQQMKKIAGTAQNITFTGFVPNQMVPHYLSAADVLVLPNSAKSDHAKATSPLKLFEYMAARKPMVATRIPAFEGLLRDRGNCFLVEPDSPMALANGIREAIDKRSLAQKIAQQAFREVQSYTWDQRAAAVLSRFGFTTQAMNRLPSPGKNAA